MGADMPDCRALVPRTEPAGLYKWTLDTYREKLALSGLVYEAEYAADYGLDWWLDERAKPRRVKMVRVKCSACGESILLRWGKDEKRGYGFIHPDEEEGDWPRTVTAAGDITSCPMCGSPVLVNKRTAIRDYYVAAECSVLSASLVGEQNLLALTGWTVQRRVYKSGVERLKFIPAEAYVFSASGCAQLLGWRNSYSGTAGYFISYSQSWRQPKRWSERWGAADTIFGLTPELVERSCLPHCKLNVYMQGSSGEGRYPIAYLRLYQMHPNVEHVLVGGLPQVLHKLIAGKVGLPEWNKNVMGKMPLPELDWAQRRPAQMLHLTKDELCLAQKQRWDLLLWKLFLCAKEHGELLTSGDMKNASWLGDCQVVDLVGRGPVGKSIRYLLRQCEAGDVENEDGDPGVEAIPDVSILLDYWSMSQTLGRDLNDPAVRFPQSLLVAHDRAVELMAQKEADNLAPLFRQRRRLLYKYRFAADGLLIRPAASQRELTEEGQALHHCVGTYGKRHAVGKTAIFFIRRKSSPWKPYYTLELDEKELRVRQNRGMCNCMRTPEIQAFEEKWLVWVRAGCPRNEAGRPVIAKRPPKEAGAA